MSLFMEVWQEEKTVYMVSQEVFSDDGFCTVSFVKKFDSEADAVRFMEENEELYC
jgi:hypothetical protein